MKTRRRAAAFLVAVLPLSSACHTMHFEVGDGPAGVVVKDRKTFWIGGLAPTQRVDVAQFCPNGAVGITEETTFLDGFLGVITLSIYTPRSTYYHCSAGAP